MRRIILSASLTLGLFSILLAQNPSYAPDAGWHAPDAARARLNPLATRPGAVRGGEKLFRRNCAECHGQDGTGMVKKHSADFHLPEVQEQTDGTLFWKITNGNADRGMPSFSKLPELERWQLVLYLRTLKP
ncbi:MAG: c-type cytochrome [Terriglobales bacterium]|jgi:mono/diheme cytochrome c family protein|nr:c-type cytochrome [Terriglobales bacterium]